MMSLTNPDREPVQPGARGCAAGQAPGRRHNPRVDGPLSSGRRAPMNPPSTAGENLIIDGDPPKSLSSGHVKPTTERTIPRTVIKLPTFVVPLG
jgi:hypothetical protein